MGEEQIINVSSGIYQEALDGSILSLGTVENVKTPALNAETKPDEVDGIVPVLVRIDEARYADGGNVYHVMTVTTNNRLTVHHTREDAVAWIGKFPILILVSLMREEPVVTARDALSVMLNRKGPPPNLKQVLAEIRDQLDEALANRWVP